MELEVQVPAEIKVPEWLLEQLGGSKLLAQIFWQRGIRTKEELKAFLQPKYYQPSDPYSWPGMSEAVNLLLSAVESQKRIVVYGDYDVDGITSTAILFSLLEKLGAEADYHLPDRFSEGYGLNKEVIRELAEQGVELILSCDCGISNFEEVALAQKLGMQVLITDHHQLPAQLPEAEVIVSSKLLSAEDKACYLPGAGVAYYLAQALLTELDKGEEVTEFLDLLALAIVADVVPLQKENRYLLQRGLKALKETNRLGLKELYKLLELDLNTLTAEQVAFQITPRLNAAGRLATAELGLELLLTDDLKEVQELAVEIDELNTQRKEIGTEIYEEAVALLEEQQERSSIVLYRAHWHQGVIGITAARLCEQFHKPVLLLSEKQGGGEIVGSARSIEGVHIYEALQECEQFLVAFGGHAGAAGLSLKREQLTAFIKSLESVLAKQMANLKGVKKIEVEASLDFNQLDLNLYRQLQRLAPFGEANPRPTFFSTGVEATWQKATQDGQHRRLVLRQHGEEYPAIWWWGGEEELAKNFDLVYSLTLNRWQGKGELQLEVKEVLASAPSPVEATEAKEQELEIEDWRNWQHLGQQLPKVLDALYFYEGTEIFNEVDRITRYQASQAPSLVLLSCPPSVKILKDLLKEVQPQRLILAYSELELKSIQSFLKELIGLIKHVLKAQGGQTTVRDLAVFTAQREETVFCALKYLQQQGLIKLEFGVGDRLCLSKSRGAKEKQNSQEQRLKALLSESRAFRDYMLTRSLVQIKRLLQSE
ncbi:single-stranded-DNA-specific exonuclease RecJ [Fuchsiella alkaliacetigena]|uniref:single-stranded-DNA-specific exonuclease RecJ n=1 Tax=Fuchsiella alkaliacetigena TaxID=957042 RepID=UPI00200A3C28|nr:single-stranded-DNA-specific exonuclease RecJ [Fuchsiella alkaliacetigena]MCK8825663.1 single-stranded-DNA-specific exonuclease RecJ [Fuchsiella alkaliacetigena]